MQAGPAEPSDEDFEAARQRMAARGATLGSTQPASRVKPGSRRGRKAVEDEEDEEPAELAADEEAEVEEDGEEGAAAQPARRERGRAAGVLRPQQHAASAAAAGAKGGRKARRPGNAGSGGASHASRRRSQLAPEGPVRWPSTPLPVCTQARQRRTTRLALRQPARHRQQSARAASRVENSGYWVWVELCGGYEVNGRVCIPVHVKGHELSEGRGAT